MTIELICRHCGRPFQPEKRDLVRGPEHYHYCSEFCRLAASKRRDGPLERLPAERVPAAWKR
jgi:hypothetical protein